MSFPPTLSLSLSIYLSIYLSFSIFWLSFLFFFFKWTVPGLFLIYFRLFKQHYNLYKLNLKNVHPVYGAGIQTHDLLNITTRPGFPPLLPPPLSFFIILLSRIVKFSHPFSRIKMFERNSRKILTTKSIERVLKTNLKTWPFSQIFKADSKGAFGRLQNLLQIYMRHWQTGAVQ